MARVVVASLVAVVLLASCGDDPTHPGDPFSGGDANDQPDPTQLRITGDLPESDTIEAVIPVGVTVEAADGSPVAGVPVEWTVVRGDGSVQPAVDTTDAQGEAETRWTLGPKAGEAVLSAEVEGLSAVTVTVEVTAGNGAEVSIERDTVWIADPGETFQLAASLLDRNGNELPSPGFEWSAADTDIAAVDSTGLVTARGSGETWIAASVQELRDSVLVQVGGSPPPTWQPSEVSLDSIAPDTLVAGETAVIYASGLDPSASANAVTIGGVPARTVAVDDDRLTVRVPANTAYTCGPVRAEAVVLSVAGAADSTAHPLRVATRRSLAAGEAVYLSAADAGCSELADSDGEYLISVYNTSESPATRTAFRLWGASAAQAATVAMQSSAPTPRTPRTRRPTPRQRPAWAGDESSAHRHVLDAGLRLTKTMGAPPVSAGRRFQLNADAGTGTPPSVGDVLSFRVPDTRSSNACSNYIEVRGRVVHVGQTAVMIEDVDAPLAGTMDSYYEAIGSEFDATMAPILTSHFGDPLAMDASLDDNGRIIMLFTKAVNDIGGLEGFVWTGDYYPRTTCEQSNGAEIAYIKVPTTPTGSPYTSGTPEHWYWHARATVMHEAKHLVSYSERFAQQAGALEETWLEESTARIAEELWARTQFGYDQHQNVTYEESIHCEVRTAYSSCENKPLVMWSHYVTLYDFFENPAAHSPLGPVASGDNTYYSSGWLFLRWLLDQHASSEASFLSALTRAAETGLDNIRARTGRSFGELLGPWTLSWYADDADGSAPALATQPSWHVRDVFAGLNREYGASFPEAFPLAVDSLAYGSFAVDVASLRGGSASLFLLRGTQAAPQLIGLQDGAGDAPPANLGLAILRLR